jgi:oxygen-independent coproporphyrinogen-3 oxidase
MHIYIHVPFCRKKCVYCGFASIPVDQEAVWVYIQGVLREMELRARHIFDRRVQTVFVGGGTPSLLPIPALERLLGAVRYFFSWNKDAEISLEANPDSVHSAEQVRAWQELGVNRISLGVQSLDRNTLRFLGRSHTAEQAESAVRYLKQACVHNFGLDLIWGIPGQDAGSWLSTVHKVLAWNPAHLSLYSLSVEPNTPLARLDETNCLEWPDELNWEQMFLGAQERLVQSGYEHYEISNYALPGRQCRHNSSIWQGEEYIGFGPSAVSTVQGIRRYNPEGLADYVQMIASNRPVWKEEFVTSATARWEQIMLGLRTSRGIARHDAASHLDMEAVSRLEQAGFFKISRGRLVLTSKGMLVSNEILAQILP